MKNVQILNNFIMKKTDDYIHHIKLNQKNILTKNSEKILKFKIEETLKAY